MRKATCIIYFVCIASLNSFSQKLFSFDALAKMTKCSDVSCFDDSVTNNGYSFSKTIELTNGAGTMTLYSGDNPESDGMANQMSIVVFNENGGNARSVALRTTNKAYYLKVKKILSTRNYTLVKTTKPDELTMRYYYKKGSYGVQISVDRLQGRNGMVTSYDINVLSPANPYWPGL